MPQESQPTLRLVAHRGWSTRFPENSLVAFGAALAAGADEIELDAWCSSDRVPFVCHDSTVERTSSLTGPCNAFTMAELKRAEIRMPDGGLLPGVGFPTLEEAIAFCAGRVPLNIHVKETGPDDRILKFLRDVYGGVRPACGSYIAGDRDVLAAAADVFPELPRCCLAGANGAEMLAIAKEFGCERVQFWRERYTQADVDGALAAGMTTNMFWSDDAEEIVRLHATGITTPLTNDIGAIQAALRDRAD